MTFSQYQAGQAPEISWLASMRNNGQPGDIPHRSEQLSGSYGQPEKMAKIEIRRSKPGAAKRRSNDRLFAV
ncbi:MAG: hypothetical protein Q8N89_06435 [Azonexus sp.]|nr:hypothetical protein [Azonexus sp.]